MNENKKQCFASELAVALMLLHVQLVIHTLAWHCIGFVHLCKNTFQYHSALFVLRFRFSFQVTRTHASHLLSVACIFYMKDACAEFAECARFILCSRPTLAAIHLL